MPATSAVLELDVHLGFPMVLFLFLFIHVGNPIGTHERKDRCPTRHVSVDGPEDPGRTRSLHGYGIARPIEQISGELLSVNQGTLYPVLLNLEQEGSIASEMGDL